MDISHFLIHQLMDFGLLLLRNYNRLINGMG